jgi:hypothetical protein
VHVGTVAAHMTQPATNFTVVNDRVVFDNGITKRWRCPVCAWWREWQIKSCSACGTHRDTSTAKPRPRGSRRLESSEPSRGSPVLGSAE